jgi:hypothetical protein
MEPRPIRRLRLGSGSGEDLAMQIGRSEFGDIKMVSVSIFSLILLRTGCQ